MNFTTELFCVAVLLSLFVASVHNRDCYAVTKSRVFMWLDKNGQPDVAYCDQDTDGGGWRVIQRRIDGSVDFFRNWTEYENGFGDPNGEFWLGLRKIHLLTSSQHYSLRVDLEDWDGSTAYAEYKNFSISGPHDFYRLSIAGYSGNAGDAMRVRNNNQQFSTWDENRSGNRLNCALNNNHGAWWYSAVCTDANLNGRYKAGGKPVLRTLDWDGIVWWAWHRDWRSLRHVEMKIRTKA